MFSELVSGSRGPCWSLQFWGKTIYSHSAAPPRGTDVVVVVVVSLLNLQPVALPILMLRWTSIPFRAKETGKSSGLMWPLARWQTFPTLPTVKHKTFWYICWTYIVLLLIFISDYFIPDLFDQWLSERVKRFDVTEHEQSVKYWTSYTPFRPLVWNLHLGPSKPTLYLS